MAETPTEQVENRITLTYDPQDGMWVITDHSEDITTQGSSKEEALLMLADAIQTDEDLLALSESIFTIK